MHEMQKWMKFSYLSFYTVVIQVHPFYLFIYWSQYCIQLELAVSSKWAVANIS